MIKFQLIPLNKLVKRVKVGFVGPVNAFYCSSSDGVPIIRTTDIIDLDYKKLKHVTCAFHEKNKKSKLKRGDLIIARHGTNGSALIYNDDKEAQVLNAVIIEPDLRKMDSWVLKLHFESPYLKKQILGSVKGSIQGVINTKHIADLIIPINSSINYNSVSNIIQAFENKIELNKRINTELEGMAKLIYEYWFVQFDFPFDFAQGKPADDSSKPQDIRPYKSDGGKMVWNKELKREIPEGWSLELIGNILENENKTSKIPSNEYELKGEIPIIDQSTDFICGYTNNENARIKTSSPRIVFGDHTRILKLINFDFARGADGTQVLLSNNSRVPQHYFYQSLLMIDLTNYGYARHFKFLKDFTIILPDLPTSQSFERQANSWYKSIKQNIFENQQLSSLRDWLLPMLMNGQVRVKEF